MVGGAWGVISTGLLTNPARLEEAFGKTEHYGWFYHWGNGSGDFTLMGIQLLAVLFIFGWTFVIMGIWFYGLNLLGWLRIDPLEEEVGMDISRHKGAAYDIVAAPEASVDALNQSRSNRGTKKSKTDSAEDPVAVASGAPADEQIDA